MYTYGFGVNRIFDERKHTADKIYINDYGVKRIRDWFRIVVEIGTSVDVGKNMPPIKGHMNKTGINGSTIYASTERSPEFVTDQSCKRIGQLILGEAPGETVEDNAIEHYFAFGDTELKVTIKILKTGQELTKIIDSL